MNDMETERLEGLLAQIPLNRPSTRLDDAIRDLASVDLQPANIKPRSGGRSIRGLGSQPKFGWAHLAATAIAASVFGLMVGQVIPYRNSAPIAVVVDPSPVEVELASSVGGKSDPSKITQVSFNVAAFEMMHGHSEQPEFENCTACHTKSSVEAFDESWFYGDLSFFDGHRLLGTDECSACHVFEGDGTGPKPNPDNRGPNNRRSNKSNPNKSNPKKSNLNNWNPHEPNPHEPIPYQTDSQKPGLKKSDLQKPGFVPPHKFGYHLGDCLACHAG